MEEISKLPTDIGQSVGQTFKIYEPLLRARAAEIQATKFETFSYGGHPRQTLDVYYPSVKRRPSIVQAYEPVLIFFHGGGLVNGSKRITPYADGLAHANVGHFFAERMGYTTVIPDYRLLSHGARFPSGGEDLSMVVDWVRESLTKKPGYSAIELFILGNSAGGIHLSTYALSPDFAGSRAKVTSLDPEADVILRGMVFHSVPFNFKKAAPTREKTLKDYFGDDLFVNSPQGLLKAAMLRDPDDVLPHTAVMLLTSTLDPDDEILDAQEDFLNEWVDLDEEGREAVRVSKIEGHNHISPPLSLGTAIEKEEAWGYQVGEFLESIRG